MSLLSPVSAQLGILAVKLTRSYLLLRLSHYYR